MKDKELELKREKYISKLSFTHRLLIKLKILRVWYEWRDERKLYTFQCEIVNKWNPFTWIFMILCFLAFIILGIYKGSTDFFETMKDSFKIQKYG